jgi:hypothetical protein
MGLLEGQLEMLSQAAERSPAQIANLKGHAFDLLAEAIEAEVQKVALDGDEDPEIRKRCLASLRRLREQRASLIDVRSHLIELSTDWKCSACGCDAAAAASVVGQDPLQANLVCRACQASTPLTSRGSARLKELFGHLGRKWNPVAHGFLR